MMPRSKITYGFIALLYLSPICYTDSMTKQLPHGVINHSSTDRKTDYLYRISLKCLVRNEAGEILVVKEDGRTYWDLPGGGMDHTESIKQAIAREMSEEVGLKGDFIYHIIDVDEPAYSTLQNFWQVRLIFEVKPANMSFDAGEDGDEITFVDPKFLETSESEVERRIYRYSQQ